MQTALPTACGKGFRGVLTPPPGSPRTRGAARLRLVGIRPEEPTLDAALVSLAGREARCRLRLGRLAAAFLSRSGHHRLGFARVGDYSRERLGISDREMQELASVATRLVELPTIGAAFLGGQLTWSQVRLLAVAAGVESEREWLERARGKTVRELLAEIRGRGAAGDGGGDDRDDGSGRASAGGVARDGNDRDDDPGATLDLPARSRVPQRAVAGILDDEAGTIEGEETVRVRVRCPARVRVLWRRAVELGRRMLGTEAPAWQVAEAIAAEGLAGTPGVSADGAEPGEGFETAGVEPPAVPLPPPGPDAPPNCGLRASPTAASIPAVFSGTAAPATVAWTPVDVGSTAAPPGVVAPDAFGPAASARDVIVRGAFARDPSARNVPASDAFALDEQMRNVVRILQRLDAEAAKLLRRALGTKLHRSLGFSSFDIYVRERLGISPSRAWALVRIDRRAGEVPALERAFREGELSWVRLQTILPVSSGAEAARWVRRAHDVTVRQLALEVEESLDAADLQMCARAASELAGHGGASNDAASLQMCASFVQTNDADGTGNDRIGDGDSPGNGDGATDGARASDGAARAEAEHASESGVANGGAPLVAVADREVAFRAPASVAGLFRDAVSAFTPTSKARDPRLPRWIGLEQLLLHAISEWSSQPRHRDPVFERDGWRCAVPACSSRRNLHDHHRQFRSRGGTNERSNRVTTCAWHHLRGIHGGLVAVDGVAPDGLTWRLGLRPGRAPLLVFDGDRYRARDL